MRWSMRHSMIRRYCGGGLLRLAGKESRSAIVDCIVCFRGVHVKKKNPTPSTPPVQVCMSKRSAWTNRSALSLFSPTFVAVHYRYEHEIKRLKSVIRHTGRGIDQGSVSAADMDDNRDLEEENLKLLEELSKTKYVNKGAHCLSVGPHIMCTHVLV